MPVITNLDPDTKQAKVIKAPHQKVREVVSPFSSIFYLFFNVDFYIKIRDKFIGLQIKPAGGVSHIPEIYKEHGLQIGTHKKFTEKFGGKVFYIISIKQGDKKVIHNTEIIDEIKQEINRLQ